MNKPAGFVRNPVDGKDKDAGLLPIVFFYSLLKHFFTQFLHRILKKYSISSYSVSIKFRKTTRLGTRLVYFIKKVLGLGYSVGFFFSLITRFFATRFWLFFKKILGLGYSVVK